MPLSLGPLFGEYHRRPNVAIRFFTQAADAGKWHVRPRDQRVFVHEPRQQLSARSRGRGVVNVKHNSNVSMTQLDELLMDGVAPKQDLLPARGKFVACVSRGVTMQGNELDAVPDRLGVAERVPLAGLDVRRRNALRGLEERLDLFRRFGSVLRRQPKVAFRL